MLLQCATPDAVARLRYTELAQQADELWATYFEVQEHSSLTAFLRNVLTTEQGKTGKGRLIQVKCKNYFFSVEYELGSVHMYPGIFESAAFFFWIQKFPCLHVSRIQIKFARPHVSDTYPGSL